MKSRLPIDAAAVRCRHTMYSSASPQMDKIGGLHHDAKLTAREQISVRLWIDTAAQYAGTSAALGTGQIGAWWHNNWGLDSILVGEWQGKKYPNCFKLVTVADFAPVPFALLLFRRADRPALDELGLGEARAAVVLAAGHVVGPAHNAPHHRAGVPTDVSDRRLEPGEGRVGLAANERNVLRCQDAPPGEVLLGSGEDGCLVDDQRGGWG